MSSVYYHDYLQLNKIIEAQSLESVKHQKPAHDEMLFIVIHQAYELWFKQILHEVDSVIEFFQKPSLKDDSPDQQIIIHRLNRTVTILRLLVQQMDVMETMTPMDFLEFRDMLRPASGFQSWQFKVLEARLGLPFEARVGQEYYLSQLRPEHVNLIKEAEAKVSMLNLINKWLERMPFFHDSEIWQGFSTGKSVLPLNEQDYSTAERLFWNEYFIRYASGLAGAEEAHREFFETEFFKGRANGGLSAKAARSALFIMLYRGYPMLQLPFQLLQTLLDIDEQLSTWRYRHMNMVHRTIGSRIGTGGSSGKDYLKSALDQHYIFKDIARLTSFLMERSRLPELPKAVEERLGFRA